MDASTTVGPLPTRPDDVTVDQLNAVLSQHSPGVALDDFAVVEAHQVGDGHASSAARMVIAPTYSYGSPPGLPRRVVVKLATPDAHISGVAPLYSNEVAVYTGLNPATFLEAPVSLGGAFHPETSTFLLLLEDLRERDVRFGSVTADCRLDTLRSLLDQLAALHARYWDRPELSAECAWLQAHTRGEIHQLFSAPDAIPVFAAYQAETTQFKRELVQRMGTTLDALFHGVQALQRHQARLPQTICHGDTHIGNTYWLADGRGGLLDWQLTSRGYAIHDVSYLIATALSIEDRRNEERELLDYYRTQLHANGAVAPAAEELWTEYRRAMIWGVFIGWLITPVTNYGWEIAVMNHLRVMTAYEDLETGRLIDALGPR